MSEDRAEYGVRPLPCVRDEHGAIAEQTVKRLIAKIDEELNELKELIYHEVGGYDVLHFLRDDEIKELIAEEAADTITAITTFCYYCGIDEEMRDEAQRRVNNHNREKGRL